MSDGVQQQRREQDQAGIAIRAKYFQARLRIGNVDRCDLPGEVSRKGASPSANTTPAFAKYPASPINTRPKPKTP